LHVARRPSVRPFSLPPVCPVPVPFTERADTYCTDVAQTYTTIC